MINIAQPKLLFVVLTVLVIIGSGYLVWNIRRDSEQIIKQSKESASQQENRVEPITTHEQGTPLIDISQGDGAAQKVGHEVIEALQTEGHANVMIMLTEPPSMRAPHIDLPALKQAIGDLQDAVLAQLYGSPGIAVMGYRYNGAREYTWKMLAA